MHFVKDIYGHQRKLKEEPAIKVSGEVKLYMGRNSVSGIIVPPERHTDESLRLGMNSESGIKGKGLDNLYNFIYLSAKRLLLCPKPQINRY